MSRMYVTSTLIWCLHTIQQHLSKINAIMIPLFDNVSNILGHTRKLIQAYPSNIIGNFVLGGGVG